VLIATTPAVGRLQALVRRPLPALLQMVKKTIHHTDHVNIPWVEFALLNRLLQEADGQSSPGVASRRLQSSAAAVGTVPAAEVVRTSRAAGTDCRSAQFEASSDA